jgi:predicted Fe-Mo cluster-binding NifX family protein
MNIAITTEDGKVISSPAETCHNFLVYEIVDGEIHNRHKLTLPDMDTLGKFDLKHEDHPLDGVLVIISAGMKRSMEHKLMEIGIKGVVTGETDPDVAVMHFLDGELPVEAAGHHKKHHYKMMNEEKGYVPMGGSRHVAEIN